MDTYLRAKIMDVKIYDRALTPSEIARLYWLTSWYYKNWWQRLWMMVKETYFIFTNSETRGGFDFWWTSYSKIVY